MPETDEEWGEDFGARGLTDAELESLLERVRQTGDIELRRAVKQFQALRFISRQLLSRVEANEPEASDSAIKLARFLVRGEGAIGSERA